MAKSCETFEHTADIGLSACADSLDELFEALAGGLVELICPRQQVCPRETRNLTLAAEDIEALIVDFLSEIMITVQTHRFVLADIKVSQKKFCEIDAQLTGEPFDPERHQFLTEIKAVTYHLLDVSKQDNQWTGRVVLDI